MTSKQAGIKSDRNWTGVHDAVIGEDWLWAHLKSALKLPCRSHMKAVCLVPIPHMSKDPGVYCWLPIWWNLDGSSTGFLSFGSFLCALFIVGKGTYSYYFITTYTFTFVSFLYFLTFYPRLALIANHICHLGWDKDWTWLYLLYPTGCFSKQNISLFQVIADLSLFSCGLHQFRLFLVKEGFYFVSNQHCVFSLCLCQVAEYC